MGRPKKDRFADLDTDFQNAVLAMSEDDIRSRISSVSLNHAALMAAKADDEDLKQKKEIAKEAGAVYREGGKAHKLMIDFCRQVLGDKGKDNGSFEQA